TVRFGGTWQSHVKYGEQFRADRMETTAPATVTGMEKYLGSGLVKGIGPVMAGRIVRAFGMDTLDVIEETPERLLDIEGIGEKRLARITGAWAEQKEIRNVMLFLQSHGVSAGFAVKIFRQYGSAALELLRENPYRLATDIWGIGFLTADRIASRLGFLENSPLRLEAGVLHVLHTLADEGHVYCPRDVLVKTCLDVLGEKRRKDAGVAGAPESPESGAGSDGSTRGWPEGASAERPEGVDGADAVSGEATAEDILRAVAAATAANRLVVDARTPKRGAPEEGALAEESSFPRELSADGGDGPAPAVYLTKYYTCEEGIAAGLLGLCRCGASPEGEFPPAAVEAVLRRLSITLAEAQRDALRMALGSRVSIITGGPGTGKTTILKVLLELFAARGRTVLLAAPTGRAAKRMAEATGREAKTIHRLLEYAPSRGAFSRNASRPLECDLLVVDEASMIDTVLMYHLVMAVPPGASLLLVGDIHQLPSVGAGNVLSDLIRSGAFPVTTLTEIFRQARESRIVLNAHRINAGKMPRTESTGEELTDFYFIEKEEPERVADIIVALVRNRIPRRFGLDPVEDVQVLTPMHRGVVGAGNLNLVLQKALNPRSLDAEAGFLRGGRVFAEGDKVMQIRNNYDKEVFNGDMGRIVRLDREEQTVTVRVEGRDVPYDFSEMDELVHAYAVSVHKSQGSEYPAVVIPLLTQHYMLLQRNLLYTAVTRGKKLVVLVGTRKALAIAVRNDRREKRYSLLTERIMAARRGAVSPALSPGL
uniref:SF1B family DNA helicase RecD2 n=1 Tax=Aminiphilus sp. TaxID=1872488 RepID=UPI0026387E19